MHLAENILPLKWAATWYGPALVFLSKGLYDIKQKAYRLPSYKPLLGLLGAAVFLISLLPIPVPFTGTSSHPTGAPMAAILTGPFVGTVLSTIALLLQALFLSHGGISTLGANVTSMGIVGSFVGYIVFKILKRRDSDFSLGLAAGLAGFMGDLAVYITTSVQLALAYGSKGGFGKVFITVLVAYLPTQVPLAVLEGLVTAGMMLYINKHRQDILINLGILSPGRGNGNDAFSATS